MTDYTRLIERLRDDTARHDDESRRLCNQAAEAIEALQGENGQLHAILQSARTAFEQVCKHRDALQAKLDELQRQEPVAYTTTEELDFLKDKRPSSAMLFNFTEPDQKFVALYAAPKALEPLTDDQIVDLAKIDCGIEFGTDDIAEDQAIKSVIALVRAAEKHHGITKGTP